jgi:Holliday junction DNA helicase RuvA
MIETLYGRIYEVSTAASTVIVECNGVGYRVTVSANTASQLPRPQFAPDGTALAGDPIRIFTHMSVREDAVELFGFYTREELDMFRLLIGVSGVGPKAAMSILSLLTPGKLSAAIVSGDSRTISRAPGVGPKTAARVTLELKDKVIKMFPVPQADEGPVTGSPVAADSRLNDARDALSALGYSRSEVAASLKNIDPTDEVEDIIRKALNNLMKN